MQRFAAASLVLVLALAAGAARAETLTNEEVIKLVEAKFSEELIAQKIGSSECRFDLSTDGLLKLKEKNVPPAIIKLMMDTNDRQLKEIKVAVQMALQGLKDKDPAQADRALRALKRLGPDAIGEIARQGLSSDSAAVRAGSAEAIGLIGHRDGLDPLFDALADREAEVRAAAARALKPVLDGEAAAARDKAVKRLLDMLRLVDKPRDGAVLALGWLGEARAAPEIRGLVEAINAPIVRRAAAAALGLMGDKDGLDLLIKIVLEDRDAEVRAAAAFSLAQLGDPKAVPPLLKSFERFPQERARLVGPLSRFRDPKVVAALIEAIDDEDPKVGELAWEALKVLTGERLKKSKQDWADWWELAGKKRF